MPIENSWGKMGIQTKLDIAPAEWELAKAAMQQEIAQRSAAQKQYNTKLFSFKIERENVGNRGGGVKGLKHSFVVVNGNLIALARAKVYFDAGIERHEGILGYGAFAVCKLGQMENGDQVAVKIEPRYIDEITKNAEINILKELGALQGEFIRTRSESSWLNNNSITDKHYTIETLQRGENMENLLHKPTLKLDGYSVDKELLLAFNVAKSIQQLHARNIVHNDIKPENFIVNRETCNVAVIDFGFAVKLPYAQAHEHTVGFTHEYAAPETEMSDDCSKSSDVYELGQMYQQHFNLGTIIDNSVAGVILKKQLSTMCGNNPANRVTMDNVVLAFEKYYVDLKEQQDIKAMVAPMVAQRELCFYSTARGSIVTGRNQPHIHFKMTIRIPRHTRPY